MVSPDPLQFGIELRMVSPDPRSPKSGAETRAFLDHAARSLAALEVIRRWS
jgi:hypothetical protein